MNTIVLISKNLCFNKEIYVLLLNGLVLVLWNGSWFSNHLAEEERAGCFT